MVERRSPKPHVVGSSPARPAIGRLALYIMKIKDYLLDTRQELTKVTWPDRRKVVTLVIIIIIVVTIVSVYVLIADALISFLMNVLGRIITIKA